VTHRIVWPIAALLGLIVLVVGLSNVPAQRFRPGGGMPDFPPSQPGRFAVAHASATRVLILDTATGTLYRATEDDFKKMSEMPRFGGPMPLPGPFDKDKDRPGRFVDKAKDKPGPGRFIDKAKDRPDRFADKDKAAPPRDFKDKN
jgi:hypothetical protein